MIYPLSGLVVGALLGAFRAKRRGGTAKDIAQWAAAFGILFALVGLFVLIFVQRSVVQG